MSDERSRDDLPIVERPLYCPNCGAGYGKADVEPIDDDECFRCTCHACGTGAFVAWPEAEAAGDALPETDAPDLGPVAPDEVLLCVVCEKPRERVGEIVCAVCRERRP